MGKRSLETVLDIALKKALAAWEDAENGRGSVYRAEMISARASRLMETLYPIDPTDIDWIAGKADA